MASTGFRICRRQRMPLLFFALTLASLACSTPESSRPGPSADDLKRREQVRAQLRSRLGELYDEPFPDGTLEQVRHGARLYDKVCRSCHGATARGNGPSAEWLIVQPPDLGDTRSAAFFSDQAKLTIVAEGIDGTPMLGWGNILGEQDQMDVLLFMKTLIRDRQAK